MKDKTREVLLNELHTHKYSMDYTSEYNLDRLFEIYCSSEIEGYSDFFSKHSSYALLVLDNSDLIADDSSLQNSTPEAKIKSLRSILWNDVSGFVVFSPICYDNYRKEQSAYVSMINHLTSKRDRVLDVGAGKVPVSSIFMAKTRDKGSVSAMDQIKLPDEILEKMGVKKVRGQFNHHTNIDNYDIVTAHRACDAFPSIVHQCSRSNKAYFFKLCNCSAPAGTIGSWAGYLRELDSNIKFDSSGYYATNIDVSKDTFDMALMKSGCNGR